MLKRLSIWTMTIFVLGAMTCGLASAQDDKLKKEELDQLLAPIALYPDDLLTNVLMASTYPLDVVAADRWRREPATAKLKGDALTKSLEAKDWDPSVKALVQFPDVLKSMSDKLDWTQKLGDAFLAQQSEVMDEIQFLRAKADEAGHLKSTKQQKVVKETGSAAQPVYIIEPATPETIYVPVYQPAVVYGPWWYPAYPPYYWGYPGAAYVNGFFWGAGVAVATGIWGWNHCDWHRHDIDINVNKWNNINVNRTRIANNTWEHRPDHRGPVPYRNKDVRDKFKQADRGPIGDKDFRGHDRSDIENRLKATDHARIDDRAGNIRDKGLDRAGDGPGKINNRADGANKIKGGAGDRAGAKDIGKAANRDIDRPKARKPPPAALNVQRGADVRRNADRGRASRTAMAGPRGGGAIQRGGGGGRLGGGHGGGGRRR
ncbi:DUF3300 domain-containing protein [Hyphomicrobium sp.]|uniref:DUF3300 domain-containing protein n=1 Tax=Hyphomicrobium sp. TaxID=82 RepID=UPI003F724308